MYQFTHLLKMMIENSNYTWYYKTDVVHKKKYCKSLIRFPQ